MMLLCTPGLALPCLSHAFLLAFDGGGVGQKMEWRGG